MKLPPLSRVVVTVLSFPDTIPLVTVPAYSFETGVPTVNTVSPISSLVLSPNSAVEITYLASILKTAASTYSSLPSSVASTSSPFVVVILKLDEPLITWLFVKT